MQTLGLGLYTLSEAATLVGAEKRSIKRWLFGYDYSRKTTDGKVSSHSDPLWQTQYTSEELNEPVVGFHDLLELRIVHRFVECGVPLIVVRRCLNTAREMFGSDYPLSRQRFATDGETIYHQAVVDAASGDEPEAGMLNLKSRQYAFRSIIRDSLYAGIEYGKAGATRWFPQARSRVIVLDPAMQFGHPALVQSGVPTASIYASFLAEGQQAANVARMFEVPVREVTAAVRFEERLRQAA